MRILRQTGWMSTLIILRVLFYLLLPKMHEGDNLKLEISTVYETALTYVHLINNF